MSEYNALWLNALMNGLIFNAEISGCFPLLVVKRWFLAFYPLWIDFVERAFGLIFVAFEPVFVTRL